MSKKDDHKTKAVPTKVVPTLTPSSRTTASTTSTASSRTSVVHVRAHTRRLPPPRSSMPRNQPKKKKKTHRVPVSATSSIPTMKKKPSKPSMLSAAAASSDAVTYHKEHEDDDNIHSVVDDNFDDSTSLYGGGQHNRDQHNHKWFNGGWHDYKIELEIVMAMSLHEALTQRRMVASQQHSDTKSQIMIQKPVTTPPERPAGRPNNSSPSERQTPLSRINASTTHLVNSSADRLPTTSGVAAQSPVKTESHAKKEEIKDEIQCAICMSGIGTLGMVAIRTLPCMDVFHAHCINDWFAIQMTPDEDYGPRTPSCPVCRRPATTEMN